MVITACFANFKMSFAQGDKNCFGDCQSMIKENKKAIVMSTEPLQFAGKIAYPIPDAKHT